MQVHFVMVYFFKRSQLHGLFRLYFFLCTVSSLFSPGCVFMWAPSVGKEMDPFRLRVSEVPRSKNVYSCTQCWHLKSEEMGYGSNSEYALIVLFSPSFHRPQPRRTKFPSSWMPAKGRWSGHWDPVFDSMVQHKHSILFVGPANIKYLNRQR